MFFFVELYQVYQPSLISLTLILILEVTIQSQYFREGKLAIQWFISYFCTSSYRINIKILLSAQIKILTLLLTGTSYI